MQRWSGCQKSGQGGIQCCRGTRQAGRGAASCGPGQSHPGDGGSSRGDNCWPPDIQGARNGQDGCGQCQGVWLWQWKVTPVRAHFFFPRPMPTLFFLSTDQKRTGGAPRHGYGCRSCIYCPFALFALHDASHRAGGTRSFVVQVGDLIISHFQSAAFHLPSFALAGVLLILSPTICAAMPTTGQRQRSIFFGRAPAFLFSSFFSSFPLWFFFPVA